MATRLLRLARAGAKRSNIYSTIPAVTLKGPPECAHICSIAARCSARESTYQAVLAGRLIQSNLLPWNRSINQIQPTHRFSSLSNCLKQSTRRNQNTPRQGPPPPQPVNAAKTHNETQTTTSPLLPALHEDIYTLPNFLTLTRLLSAPLVGYLIAYNQYPWALAVFVYAGLTDLVDGWIARRWNMQTVVGTIVDPMADKALMTVVTVGLAWKGTVPVLLATLILGRDVLLGLSALYYRYISLPPPKTLVRYWDFSLPSAEVKPTNISKVNTFLQLALLGGTMAWMALPGGEKAGGKQAEEKEDDSDGLWEGKLRRFREQTTGQQVLQVGWYVVGLTTVWSGLSYVGWGRRRGLRILSDRKVPQ